MTAMNKELEGSLVVIAEPGTTVARIQSRLLSSKFLSIQIATSLEVLKVLLDPALKQNDEHLSNQESKNESTSLEALKVPPNPVLKQNDEHSSNQESKNESTFLPSLSVGFVRGDSDDSDWSELETEGKSTDLEPKKNRRGQRARRA